MQKISKVISLRVGKIKDYIKKDELFSSGYIKHEVNNPQKIEFIGFSKDQQADKIHHGGVDKAVLAFAMQSYEILNQNSDKKFNYGDLGENLVLSNIKEEDIYIGDILKIGSTTFEVSQPRQPCWKISYITKVDNATELVLKSGRTGWYLRVIELGEIAINDDVYLVERKYSHLSIYDLNMALNYPQEYQELIKNALETDELSQAFKKSLKPRLK